MNSKKILLIVLSIVLFALLAAGATFAWWSWTSSNESRTVINLTVEGGVNLKAIIDADNTDYNGFAPADDCTSPRSAMSTITIYYSNLTSAYAQIDATLSLDSITNTHSGLIDKPNIHWAISTNPRSTCDRGIISQGSGTLEDINDGDPIYTGDISVGSIPANTAWTSKVVYLYFWIDPAYHFQNVGDSVVSDPMQDMNIKVVWNGTITNNYVPSIYDAVATHQLKTTPQSLSSPLLIGEEGVYSYTEDGQTVYFYRGLVKDNNLLYADMCWKIVRTTKSHGVKIIYNGFPTTSGGVTYCGANDGLSQSGGNSMLEINTSQINYKFNNTDQNDPDYRNSELKPLVDAWYTTNIENEGYENMLETTDFCIDMSSPTESGTSITFAPAQRWTYRFNWNINPILGCSGEGKYPNSGYVGLLTIDEAWLAGAADDENSETQYYLVNGNGWWTLSPALTDTENGGKAFAVSGSGIGYNFPLFYGYGIRPVVSLASNLKYTGTGTYNDPFVPFIPNE